MRQYLQIASNLGALQTIHFAAQRIRNRLFPPELLTVRSRYALFPLTCRQATSDLEVFGQIFSYREYACLDRIQAADLVIDCGANVGFASAYFATRFPHAKVIAIEPDAGNYAHMLRNIAPYGSRIHPMRAAIWWRRCRLMVGNFSGGDGREWARCVREAHPNEEPDVYAVDIGNLLADAGYERISVLKIDIEGGELDLFSHPTPWLDFVDNLVIETHGPQCETVVRAACERHGITLTRYNEELIVGARNHES